MNPLWEVMCHTRFALKIYRIQEPPSCCEGVSFVKS